MSTTPSESVLGTKRSRYLAILDVVVHPEFQGRSAGTLLVRDWVHRAKAERKHVWVATTPAGRDLFFKIGFKQFIDEVMFDERTYYVLMKMAPTINPAAIINHPEQFTPAQRAWYQQMGWM
jgi:N-acetylglutamate synthase-like GNAT family acetyltransferase